MSDVVSLFAGVGTSEALHGLGLADHGIDLCPHVAAVREALGWETTTADILDLDPADWAGVEGLTASPPCQSWSMAGNRRGLDDPRGQLVWQPLVWARAIRPRWIICEQVPEAAPAFRVIAAELEADGYRAAVGVLSAEQCGVAQTRRRVFLVAHRDRAVSLPEPTHERYRSGVPRGSTAGSMLPLLPWVSMAEALGVTAPWVQTNNKPHGGPKLEWHLRYRPGHEFGRSRTAAEPAFTILAHVGKDSRRYAWWPTERPATTIMCDPRLSAPGHHAGSQNAGAVPVEQAGAAKPIALTAEQGCRLMGFGPELSAAVLRLRTKRGRWSVIGNAVCPPVAAAIMGTLIAQ